MIHLNWNKINEKYRHVELDHFIVMPNHLHGIILINDNYYDMDHKGEVTSPLHTSRQPSQLKPILGKIIAWFKYKSTKQINLKRQTPGIKLWQRNYYERIIRNEKELNSIIKYIAENPINWDSDSENPENI